MNSYGQKTKIHVGREPLWRDVRFWIMHQDWTPTSKKYRIAQMVMEPVQELIEHPPTMTLKDEDVQQFMDELWRMGFRPTEESTGGGNALAATERHLKDLQRLVFKDKPPPKP